MTGERSRPHVSSDTLATLMTIITLEPYTYTQDQLARKAYIAIYGTNRALTDLGKRGWLSTRGIDTGSAGSRPQLYGPSSSFDEAVDKTREHIASFSKRDQLIFGRSVQSRVRANELSDGIKWDEATARWLGGAALLSKRHDLGEAGWFNGRAGWESLIAITANRQTPASDAYRAIGTSIRDYGTR